MIAMSALVPAVPVINRWQKIHTTIFPPTSCTDLVVWAAPGSLSTTLGFPKWTKFIRDSTFIPHYLVGVFVGLLLGDTSISKSTKKSNVVC